MRLTLILMIVVIMQVSASTYGQNITIDQKNLTIRQIFKKIKSQTGYDILWQSTQLDAEKKIDIKFKGATLSQVINACINERGLIYEIQDQSIILKSNLKLKSLAVQDSIIYKGQVVDENNKPMGGVTVKVTGSRRSTFTNVDGNFSIYAPVKGTLDFSFIGYLGKQITLIGLDASRQIKVKLAPGNNNLGEVNIVSNGYQDIPKERSTGSFEVITKEQLQHSTDPNLINRLEGITTSMDFNNILVRNNSATSPNSATDPITSPLARLTIRGRNTLNQIGDVNASGQVLVVIDGVASPYSIDNINPNDVESITVLKDAAAASIWGARAANGVIVVNTKHGAYDRPLNISFNTDLTVTEKLNLFYQPTMSVSEFIDAQIFQFNAAGTNILPPSLNRLDPLYSPVAEILGQQKRGVITATEANSQINALRGNDIRNDYNKYLFRDASTQSYFLSIDGGSKNIAYRLSAGYNKSLNNTIASNADKLALDYNVSFKPVKNLELNADINYSRRTTEDQSRSNPVTGQVIGVQGYYPYTRLVNQQGDPVSIPYKYRTSFLNLLSSTYGDLVQNLQFNPLEDINEGYFKTISKSLNLNFGANYKLNDFISASVVYNYNLGNGAVESFNRKNSFYVRNLVTLFTLPDGTQQFPDGAVSNPTSINSHYNSLREQLNIDKNWGQKHVLNAIAGSELTDSYSINTSSQYFGLDENTLYYNNQLNYLNNYTTLFPGTVGLPFKTARFPYLQGANFYDSRVRTYSLFANAAYTYNSRYTISGSVRKDESNLFGIGTNSHGTPFYSLGASWNISNESFYKLSWLPKLQLRTTFGYNGNVNPAVQSVATTVLTPQVQNNGLSSEFASPSNVTNNALRPERTSVLNLGLDFGIKNNRISGSFEYYRKHTTDLIGNNVIDPTTGFDALTFNTANLLGWGTDLTLNSKNIQTRMFSWSSSLLFSYNRIKVQKLYTPNALTAGDVVGGGPVEGYDLSQVFAYKWAGLSPTNGDPRGYLNGQPYAVNNVVSYVNIINQPLSTAHHFGSAVPVYYGSLRNTFTYGSLSLSANLLYKFGYYFTRQNVVNYYRMFSNGQLQSAEYDRRWQKPGDEVNTNVPSLVNARDSFRDIFYQNSDINVLKGDNIKLQEINISYLFNKKNWFLKNPRIYANVRNLGIVWRANKYGLDPDAYDYPIPRSYALGLSANF